MNNLIQEISVPFSKIKIHNSQIIKLLGYSNHVIPTHISNTVNHLLLDAQYYADIKIGYKIILEAKIDIQSEEFIYNNLTFKTGKIITSQLSDSEYLSIFLTTVGAKFDSWSRSLFDNGDFDQGYIVDLIGSELAEAAADEVEKIIVDIANKNNLSTTNRLSPGYCGWNVNEQQKLFSLLPEKFCDVQLTESSLMIPMKSVSGIIGLGKLAMKRPYPCATCTYTDCYKKKNKFK